MLPRQAWDKRKEALKKRRCAQGPGIEGAGEAQMVAELSALAEAPPLAAGTAAGEVAARELDDEFSGDGDGEWELLLRCDPEAMREKAAAVAKRRAVELARDNGGGEHSSKPQQFRYVLVPADETQPIEELMASVAAELGDGGGSGLYSDDVLPQLLRGQFEEGEDGEDGVEQFALLRPSGSAQSEFVFAYGGPSMLRQGGQQQQLTGAERPNKRATAVAMECGFHAVRFHGDVGAKNVDLLRAIFMLYMIILPRQARDKHG
jgi:hypothetical protein